MKTQLLKKQIAFIPLTIGMFLFSAAHAQIVYTDVNPDQIYSSGSYNLDLNNDGTNDFTLTMISTIVTAHCYDCNKSAGSRTNKTLKVQPLGNNEFGSYIGNSRLNQNMLIDSNSLSWSNNIQMIAKLTYIAGCTFNSCIAVPSYNGDWSSSATDNYLGLRIYVGPQIYYGWVRLDVGSGVSSFTVKDYAFNSIPGQSILAGVICPAQVTISVSGATAFCAGGSVILTVGTPAISYQWEKNGSVIAGATSANYTADNSGTFSYDVSYSCGTLTSNSISVTRNAKPTSTVTQSPCANGAVLLTCTATPGTGVSYQWKQWNTILSGATDSTYSATSSKTYNCTVTITATGCTKMSSGSKVTLSCKTANEASAQNDFTDVEVSPNPFSQSTLITFEIKNDENVSLKIYDVEGRLIRALANEAMSAGTHSITWNAQDENRNAVSAGIYFLQIQSAHFSRTQKLMVTH